MRRILIIKLGGSVITDKKSSRPIFKPLIVKRICQEIYDSKKKNNFDLIIVHGAGSFGHPTAKKYKLNKGYIDEKSSVGISKTKKWILKLNLLIIEHLTQAKLNSALVESSSVVNMSNGKLKNFNISPIINLLEKGIIPVLSGDIAFDDKIGISIISGDTICTYLAQKLKASKLIFVSNVDGIFDKNPKIYKNARLINKLTSENYGEIFKDSRIYNSNDVTNEMRGKVGEIRKMSHKTIVLIVNGLKGENVKKSILSNKVGTLVDF